MVVGKLAAVDAKHAREDQWSAFSADSLDPPGSLPFLGDRLTDAECVAVGVRLAGVGVHNPERGVHFDLDCLLGFRCVFDYRVLTPFFSCAKPIAAQHNWRREVPNEPTDHD